MGAVYKAEQAPLGRLVALKVLSPRGDEAGNAEFRRRFLLEASTSAKLTHPNTVRVFDYGQTEDGFFFIAMELLEGKTLKQVLAEKGAMSADRAVDVAKQVCRSLREAHRLGVVHRDIKPGNVMLVDRGGEEAAKVLDFGLAKDVSAAASDANDATQTGVFLGSPKYVSPEQVQGEALDARSDIYSLGVVLYELLSGKPPFAHEQPMQALMAHVRDAPPKLVAPPSGEPIPPSLEAVVMRCLAKRPDDRWPDMEALLVALKEWQGGTTSMSGDLSLSISQDGLLREGAHGAELDARSGVHVVTGPMIEGPAIPSDPPPQSLETISIPPEASGAEAGQGGSRTPWMLGALAFLVVLGGGAWWLTRPADAELIAAPPPRPAASAVEAPPVVSPTPDRVVVAPDEPLPAEPLPVEPLATVLVALRSVPTGAMVRIGDRDYGPTPAEVELTGEQARPGTELTLVFTHAGFRDQTETVTVEGTTLEVRTRMARTGGRGAGGGSSSAGSAGAGGTDVHVEGYRDSPY